MNRTIGKISDVLCKRGISAAIILMAWTTVCGANLKGVVTDKKSGEPIIGATIQLAGNSTGTITDFDGNYSLECADGIYDIIVRYIGYENIELKGVKITAATERNFEMKESETLLADVTVVGKKNMESESMLLIEQRKSLIATQAVGAKELSRKGVSDAEGAVAKVTGVAAGSGQKNVNVRGLADRYNSTLLNGFVIPSEDPEYKNISLAFFPTKVIQSVEVDKVFAAGSTGDVAGAGIDIQSKKLTTDAQAEASISGGINTSATGNRLMRPTGANNFGLAQAGMPNVSDNGVWPFSNQLNATAVKAPINQSYSLNGGKQFNLNASGDKLSLFAAAAYSTDYSYSSEESRNTTTRGLITKNMTGQRSTTESRHSVMANIDYSHGTAAEVSYNFMLLHSCRQYYGSYRGYADGFNNGDGGEGMTVRQQTNDNTLQIHQLHSRFDIAPRWQMNIAANYNRVQGNEPDRRINTLTNDKGEGSTDNWRFEKGDGQQQRYFSRLTEDNVAARVIATYDIPTRQEGSKLSFGYKGRYSTNRFEANLYNTNILYSKPEADPDNLDLDAVFSQNGMDNDIFRLSSNNDNYSVDKTIHRALAEADYVITPRWSANAGVALDIVDINLHYALNNDGKRGDSRINDLFVLPAINVRYNAAEQHSLRLGASKTYTLPQAKELAPFRYYDVSFASEGNKNLVPSDCYNIDLRWEWFMTTQEMMSATLFYKYIANPIARVDQANAASVLTYMNIANQAQVAGVEIELRKDLVNITADNDHHHRLVLGINGSYIYSHCATTLPGATEFTGTALEGAAPIIANADLTYSFDTRNTQLTAAAIFNYTSPRVYVTGMQGYADTYQSAVYSLDIVASLKIASHWSVGIKAQNLIDPTIALTRRTSDGNTIALSRYKKGREISLSLSYNL